jgi:signal peptidase II
MNEKQKNDDPRESAQGKDDLPLTPDIPWKDKFLPLLLSAGIFGLDQLTKKLIVMFVEPYPYEVIEVIGTFFRIIHVYNPGIAFSIGNGLSETIRGVLFAFIPLIVLIIILLVYFRSNELTRFQRWAVAGIVGGGLGNLFDRFFREKGVVDFLDFRFYGIFGFERWPTFNVADMSVLICGGLLVISFFFTVKKNEGGTE